MKTNRLLAALLFAVAIPWTAFSGYLLVLQLLDTARTGVSGGYAVMFAIPTVAGAYCLGRAVEMWRRSPSNQPPAIPVNPPANRWALPAAVFLGLSFVLPFIVLPHPYLPDGSGFGGSSGRVLDATTSQINSTNLNAA